jgi:hypothetical protein
MTDATTNATFKPISKRAVIIKIRRKLKREGKNATTDRTTGKWYVVDEHSTNGVEAIHDSLAALATALGALKAWERIEG